MNIPFECNQAPSVSDPTKRCAIGTLHCTIKHAPSTIALYTRPSEATIIEARTLLTLTDAAETIREVARALESRYTSGFIAARDAAAAIVQKRHQHYEGDSVLSATEIRALVPGGTTTGELPVGHPHRHTHESGTPCTEACPIFAVPVHQRHLDIRPGRRR